jgi:hypothetical protein
MLKQPKIISEKHRRFIASLPCAVSGRSDCQAAHIRAGYLGMGTKPPDSRCIPLNWEQHAKQHAIGEKAFWNFRLDEAIWLAGLLWDNTGNRERCLELIAKFRQ